MIELNLSCPNVDEAPETAARARRGGARRDGKPLYAKLSPAQWDVAVGARPSSTPARTASRSSTRSAASPSTPSRCGPARPAVGGYSGAALARSRSPASTRARAPSTCPIVGMGGVSTGPHALELVAAGASAVALGTVLFSDPDAPVARAARAAPRLPPAGYENPLDARAVAVVTI